MLSPVWRDILELAQRAPSPHNVQPWKVLTVSDSNCEVYIDSARTLPKEDTTGSFIISGMVMYLETMRYAAQIHQRDLQYEVLLDEPVDGNGLQLFAKVSLRRDESIVPEFEAATIMQRRTSRLGYTATAIPQADQAKLRTLVESYGHQYGYTTDTKQVKQILDQNIIALFHDLNSPSYHDEIVSWFRFSKRSSQINKDGLDYRCMHIPATDYYLSARFPIILKLPILKHIFAKRYRALLGTTPAIAWLSGSFWQPEDSVIAGKLLMKFWLELTRMGLYLHPFGNLVTNKTARDAVESVTASADIWFVIRLGYTDEPPESYRRPIENILIEEAA